MSSFSLDVSGKRALTATINDDARTACSMPSKAGDSATIQLSSFEEVAVYLPATAKLQLVHIPHEKDDEYDEYIRLVVPGQSMQLSCKAKDEQSSWPHVSVSARKWETEMDYFFAQKNAEVVNEVPLAAAVLVQVEVASGEDVPQT